MSIGPLLIRPLRAEDAEAAAALAGQPSAALGPAAGSGTAASRVARRTSSPECPADVAAYARRVRHLVAADGPGCWAAEDAGRLVGVSLSLRRDGLWGLSSLVVGDSARGAGVGRELFSRALAHAGGALRGMIVGSLDPRAVRLHRAAGFHVHPTMRLVGRVDAAMLAPGAGSVRVATAADLDLTRAVDLLVRGSAHGPDLPVLAEDATLLVADTSSGRGYAVTRPQRLELLAATDAATARALLAEVLARAAGEPGFEVPDLTAEQSWALDVGLRAGLAVLSYGFLCLRGIRPPTPYVPSAAFL